MQKYLFDLRPLGEYFLGGEKNFEFGDGTSVNNYFIHSETEISQATILGMLRFVLLKKNDALDHGGICRDIKKKQKILGDAGFDIRNEERDYGAIGNISPLVIRDYKGRVLIPIPFNHNKENKGGEYTPLKMRDGYVISELSEKTVIPKDYNAKEGIANGMIVLNNSKLDTVDNNDIFTTQIRTRVAKGLENEGFFKKEYQFLRKEFFFSFYANINPDYLPDTKSEIVFLGQEKSTFLLEIMPYDETERDIGTKVIREYNPNDERYLLFYALSDTYVDNIDELKKCLCYSIVEKKAYRFLNSVSSSGAFVNRRKKTELYQFIKAGSVFFVKREMENDFFSIISNKNLQTIGFNYIIKIGE